MLVLEKHFISAVNAAEEYVNWQKKAIAKITLFLQFHHVKIL